jgi:hypothetical protein
MPAASHEHTGAKEVKKTKKAKKEAAKEVAAKEAAPAK